MLEAVVTPRGPYSLRLTARTDTWQRRLPEGRWASARQRGDGAITVRASCERALGEARFVLALDDDTTEFHRGFANDPVLGPSLRVLRGMRPLRTATVAHAAVKAVCGQLVQSSRARALERAIVRASGADPPSQAALRTLSAAALCACGLVASRAATLARLVRTIDLERLRDSETALARLGRERGIGPWSVGVVALQGLGRYDAGLEGDLGLVKLQAALGGRWPQPSETAELLEPYGEWKGLASVFLLSGLKRGLIPGASLDRARLARRRAARAPVRDAEPPL